MGPPEGRAREREAERAVQEFRIAKARPSILRGEKERRSSGVGPRVERAVESSRPIILAFLAVAMVKVCKSSRCAERGACEVNVEGANDVAEGPSHGVFLLTTGDYIIFVGAWAVSGLEITL